MLFTEIRFIFYFVFIFITYWCLKSNNNRKVLLLLSSYLFYGVWDWRFLFLIISISIANYYIAKYIYIEVDSKVRKQWLFISILINIGTLGVFKYFNFFRDSIDHIFDYFGLYFNSVTVDIVLPVGISFFIFQAMSYSIDVYRGTLAAEKRLIDLALYISFFPQLVAGPIVRASDFLPQLNFKKTFSQVDLRPLLLLFLIGFFKKSCVSDNLSPLVDNFFSAPDSFTTLSSYISVIAYSIQIYCDFSGYSDMAISLAGLLGYQLCINFNKPYFSESITNFWQRWHISLSTWLKDYLYIPLGGNRGSKISTYKNLMTTMLLGGLWHGASWNFVIWGGMHGFALISHREFNERMRGLFLSMNSQVSQFVRVASTVLTFYWVSLLWVYFRADTLTDAITITSSLLLFESKGSQVVSIDYVLIIIALFTAHYLFSFDSFSLNMKLIDGKVFYVILAFMLSIIMTLVSTSNSPFIYFQF